MEPSFSLIFSGRNREDEENLENIIPRLDAIPNPAPNFIPTVDLERIPYNPNYLSYYHEFIIKILPRFDVSAVEDSEEVLTFLKDIFNNQEISSETCDLCAHAFLVNCSYKLAELQANASLTKISILHHVLAEARTTLYSRNDASKDHQQMCEMLLGDTADGYYNYFCDVSTKQMWGKSSNNAANGKNSLLNRELQKLRLMNKYTFNTLSTLLFRRLIDFDSNSTASYKEEMRKLAEENGIKI